MYVTLIKFILILKNRIYYQPDGQLCQGQRARLYNKMLMWRAHLEGGAETDDALQVCAVVTQNVLSSQQRDLIALQV